jgi:hypothetical protein
METWTPHNLAENQAKSLMVPDTANWSTPEMNWRFRFTFKDRPEEIGSSQEACKARMDRRNNWIEKKAKKYVRHGAYRRAAYAGGLYIEKEEDAMAFFQGLRNHDLDRDGVVIASVQNKAVFDAVCAAALVLCEGYRSTWMMHGGPEREADIVRSEQ